MVASLDPQPLPAARALGFYLPRSTFPADRGQLVCEARRAGAPEVVLRLLLSLPGPPATFRDVQDVLDSAGDAPARTDPATASLAG